MSPSFVGANVLGAAVGRPVGAADGAHVGAGVGDSVRGAKFICIQGGIGLPSKGGGGSGGKVIFAAIAKLKKVFAKLSINSIEGGSFNPARIAAGASISSCKITPDPKLCSAESTATGSSNCAGSIPATVASAETNACSNAGVKSSTEMSGRGGGEISPPLPLPLPLLSPPSRRSCSILLLPAVVR